MSDNSGFLQANIVRVEQRAIESGILQWRDGKICGFVAEGGENPELPYLIPGFVDAHVHVESSMLTPAEFARTALLHGTLGAVSDPHEIANVLGIEGVKFMLDNGEQTPFRFLFGAPSCVPATPFETSGAELGVEQVTELLDDPRIGYLSEMMNFPGVLGDDPVVLAKLHAAKERKLPIDGHAPGLQGDDVRKYAAAGIGTDHECFTIEEARAKISAGMHILIREGSAARNFDALHPLISEAPEKVMLCSDDKHPDDLLKSHINRLAARAVEQGHDLFDVLRCTSLNPVEYYGLPLGRLNEEDSMDGVLVEDLKRFKPIKAWLDGECLVDQGRVLLEHVPVLPLNRFDARPVTAENFRLPSEGDDIRVIEAQDGELITRQRIMPPKVDNGWIMPDSQRDILPICVVNRYQPADPALAFVTNFRLRRGAIASSVAHDSHNIVAVGADYTSLAQAINAVIDARGGIAVVDEDRVRVLPLPIAGIMTHVDGEIAASRYSTLDRRAKELGCKLRAPFMTLSFMALLVIPELKLSDQGLFDGQDFQFTRLEF